jgi:hypothetical protein
MTTPPRPRLRWYQYSLRSLFVLTVLVAIGGSWFAWKKQQKERERAAVKAIVGGLVRYDYQFDVSCMLIPNAKPPGPVWLRRWLGDDFFADVVYVVMNGELITDAEFQHVEDLPRLRIVTCLTSQVTDAGLEHLKDLKQLEALHLNRSGVTDAGLEHLKGLSKLKILDLSGAKVTDAGLEHLTGLTQLTKLYLNRTITDEGVKKLQQALPNCEIVRGRPR